MRLMDVNYDLMKGKPPLDYALIDFGSVRYNSRYTRANPFGVNTPVFVHVEIQEGGQWSYPGWSSDGGTYRYGTEAGFIAGEGIVVQTANYALKSSWAIKRKYKR